MSGFIGVGLHVWTDKTVFWIVSGQTVFGYGLDMGVHAWRDIRHLSGLCLDRQFCVRVYRCRFACLDRQDSILDCVWTDSFRLWFRYGGACLERHKTSFGIVSGQTVLCQGL